MAQRINVFSQDTMCHFCDKVFCCGSCRDKHELNTHGRLEQKCPLCYNDKVQIKSFNDSKVLNHLVEHHFPLYCNLCGQVFRKASDLQMFQKCNWQCTSEEGQKEKSDKEPPLQTYTTSPITRHMNSNSELRRSLSEGPSVTSDLLLSKISRFTSTPLQGSDSNMKLNPRIALLTKDLNAITKSPTTPKRILLDSLSSVNASESGVFNMKKNLETHYFSQINESDDVDSNVVSSPNDKSKWNTCKDSTYIIDADEKNDVENQPGKETFENEPNYVSSAFHTAAENSQENKSKCMINKERTPENVDDVGDSKYKYVENVHVISQLGDSNNCSENSENAKNQQEAVTNNCELQKLAEPSPDKKESISNDNGQSSNQSCENDKPNVIHYSVSQPSRMIMMVVVENNVGEFTSASLQPILESGLKQLEQACAVGGNSAHIVVDDAKPIKKFRSESSEAVVTSVDYLRVSETQYKTPVKQQNNHKEIPVPHQQPGFLSSVTQVLMNAFRRIPSIGFMNSQKPELKALPAPEKCDDSPKVGISNQIQVYTPPTRKRRWDEVDSLVLSPPPKISNMTNIETDNLFMTPCAKKYRGGWIKIKGRPPISRVHQSNSQTQIRVSSATQSFQRGMLSVGHTKIPIPTRALEQANN